MKTITFLVIIFTLDRKTITLFRDIFLRYKVILSPVFYSSTTAMRFHSFVIKGSHRGFFPPHMNSANCDVPRSCRCLCRVILSSADSRPVFHLRLPVRMTVLITVLASPSVWGFSQRTRWIIWLRQWRLQNKSLNINPVMLLNSLIKFITIVVVVVVVEVWWRWW